MKGATWWDIVETRPWQAFRSVHTKWKNHTHAVPILGLAVATRTVVWLLFCLSLGLLLMLSNDLRRIKREDIGNQVEPWIVLDGIPVPHERKVDWVSRHLEQLVGLFFYGILIPLMPILIGMAGVWLLFKEGSAIAEPLFLVSATIALVPAVIVVIIRISV